jgi:hypothetical protein
MPKLLLATCLLPPALAFNCPAGSQHPSGSQVASQGSAEKNLLGGIRSITAALVAVDHYSVSYPLSPEVVPGDHFLRDV